MRCPRCQAENEDASEFCATCAAPLGPTATDGASLTKTLMTPPPAISKDALVAGKYRIVEELGRGGMGIVYKAEDVRLKRTVALKFLPPELTHVAEIKDRFIREARAAAALDHPHICTIYEFDQAEDRAFIAMAYIEGRNLKERIDAGPLGPEEALKLATQIAEGLQEAHRKGIVHRDIKSANVMVTAKGQAKVMDFGLARTAGATLVTREGTTMGTVAYMSPEQARGEKVDHRTDIWSFGVVLYEMLTGELPFKGDHEQAVVYAILKEKPKPIPDLRADLPPSIGQVVLRALEKDPDKRYQRMDDLLDDLKSIAAGIVPDEIQIRLRREKLRKRKRAVLFGGAAVLVIAAVVTAILLFTGPAEAIVSIAVLPLENRTGDAAQEYYVDGLTEELIGHLAQINGLRRVISRTTMMRYKDTDKSLPEIARELNVEALVEGTVHEVGGKVRLRLQLFEAVPEERNLLARSYERSGADVLSMYGEIARAIADGLRVKLTAEEEARFARAPRVDPAAYDAYLNGLFHWYRLSPQDLETALNYFESALEKDPDYALAHAGIALVWIGRNQGGLVPPGLAVPQAQAAALRALELDDSLAEVHYVLGILRTWHNGEWNWKEAERSFLRALEINPNYPDARVYYSNLLCFMGRPEEAWEQGEKALELDPYNALFRGIYALTLSLTGRTDEALEQARQALTISPGDAPANSIRWEVLHLKGMYDEALEAAKEFFATLGLAPIAELLEQAYRKDGYAAAMRLAGDTLAGLSGETHISPCAISYLYVYAGDKEQTLAWLEKGLEINDPNMPYIIEPVFVDLLGDDPRYRELIRKMNLEAAFKE